MNAKDKKVVVVGSGSLGTALAKILHDAGMKNIVVYGIVDKELNDLEKGQNTTYFPTTAPIPKMKTTKDLKEALDGASYVLHVVPSQFADKVVAQILVNLNSEIILINASKGFYPGTTKSLHEGIQEQVEGHAKVKGFVSLIGPSQAEELVWEIPTLVSVVGDNMNVCSEVQEFFRTKWFKTFVQTDIIGAEVGAAYKNILAIFAGMAQENVEGTMGLKGHGINSIAAVLTRGFAEIRTFNKAMGGKPDTIQGLTGLGDLIVTATSDFSRNFTFGRNFIKKGKAALDTKATVEGVKALKSVYEIGKAKKLDLPIVFGLHDLLFGKLTFKDLMAVVWEKSPNQE